MTFRIMLSGVLKEMFQIYQTKLVLLLLVPYSMKLTVLSTQVPFVVLKTVKTLQPNLLITSMGGICLLEDSY